MPTSHSSDLVLAYLRNSLAAQANGQTDHAAFLFDQAVEWLGHNEREYWAATSIPPVQLEIGIGLDAGNNPSRTKNEDYVFAERLVRSGDRETVGIFVLADGAGGHANGQEASRIAVHAFVDEVLPRLMGNVRGLALKDLLLDGMREANKAVCLRNEDPLLFGRIMATTMTAVLSVGAEAYIANVGDSRTYLCRPGVGLKQLTRDHSYVAQLLEAGDIEPRDVYTHPKRNIIYRSLGEINVDLDEPGYLQLQNGDILLLCSDGLWEMVRDPEAKAIHAILSDSEADASEMAEALVDLALNGGGHDNIGLLVIKTGLIVEDLKTIIVPSFAQRVEMQAVASLS
ncbi:hypothetical protein KDA_75160 [Dictyobacter alpinus]|uniref:PPM-type phosphatase domain-containing protein n=1 Tax=Dictyobacter alpinus TaxID=2014873 RepID=A0A402BL18_9CHLR|nr:protein phosphatase 2C domain-containing protein [Dictyobacter alpinus]GCE32032.1 hypothetical protein KDA_75160 [Dictyobacter alpinus]